MPSGDHGSADGTGVSGHIPWEGTKTDAPTGAPSLPSEEGGRPPKIRAVSIVVVAVQRGGENPGGSPVPELGVALELLEQHLFSVEKLVAETQ